MFKMLQVENKRLATEQQLREFVKIVETEMLNNYSDIEETFDKVTFLS